MPSRSRSRGRRTLTPYGRTIPRSLSRAASLISNYGPQAMAGVEAARRLYALSRSRSRGRSGSSRTATRSTTRSGQGQHQTLVGTASNYKYSHKRSKWWKIREAIFNRSEFKDVVTVRVSAENGTQGAHENLDFDNTTLGQMRASIYASLPNTAGESVSSTSTFNTRKIMVESVDKKYTISNAENCAVYFKIYELSCIRDTNESPAAAWTTGLGLQQGTVAQGGTALLSESRLDVGNHPYQSENFKSFWKIRHTTNVALNPGQIHTHYHRGRPNYTFNSDRLNGTGNLYLAKLTHGTLIVAYGGPVHNAGETLISTADVALDLICLKRYVFRSAEVTQRLTMTRQRLDRTTTGWLHTEGNDVIVDATEDN